LTHEAECDATSTPNGCPMSSKMHLRLLKSAAVSVIYESQPDVKAGAIWGKVRLVVPAPRRFGE
jgi:hypothetical protein